MLIPQLVALAHRDSLLEDPLFEKKRVRWQVTIGPNGEFQGLGSLDERGVELLVPKKVGGNAGGVATFGTDNARFVLGLVDKPEDSAKAERDLAAFVALIERAAEEEPESEGIAAARAFYRDAAAVAAAREVAAEQKVKEADRVALAYFDDYGQNLFESEEGKAFWRRYRAEQESAKPQVEAVGCLSCGQLRPPVKTNDTKIMGVPGGQPSGTALVSFDKEAFQSHGWDKNANAAVCEPCSQAYTRALNHLLRHDAASRTRVDLAGNVFVVWSDAGPIPLLDEIEDPNHENAEAPGAPPHPGVGVDTLEAAFYRHKLPPRSPEARLFTLGLRGNGGRAVVTDWFDVTLGEAWENLRRWFDDLQVRLIFPETVKKKNGERETVREAGELSRPQPLRVLARATARDFDDISKRVPGALLRAALHGEPLPQTVLHRCLERLRRDGFGDYFAPSRMGLIRCYLNRSPIRKGEKLMPGLDPTCTKPAYVWGRLLATLEATQRLGDRGVRASITSRYYGSASTTPAVVFGRLLSLAQPHLTRIKSKKLRESLQAQISEMTNLLEACVPRTLSLEERAVFALGYWHQRAHVMAEIQRAGEKLPDSDDDSDDDPTTDQDQENQE